MGLLAWKERFQRASLTATALLLLTSSVCLAASSIDESYSKLSEIDRSNIHQPTRKRALLIRKAYIELFSQWRGSNLADVNKDDLQLLFLAASKMTAYNSDKNSARELLTILWAMDANGLARTFHYDRTYKTLINARMLQEAKNLASEKHLTNVNPAPVIIEAPSAPKQPSELLIDSTRNILKMQSVDLRDFQVIAVVSPFCHPSRNAMEDIKRDPKLNSLFKNHGKWVTSAIALYDFNEIQDWNRSHPNAQMTISYQDDQWPLEFWNTPTFYILENGVVKQILKGWSSKQHEELHQTLIHAIQ